MIDQNRYARELTRRMVEHLESMLVGASTTNYLKLMVLVSHRET